MNQVKIENPNWKKCNRKKTQRGKLKHQKVRCARVKYENTTQE